MSTAALSKFTKRAAPQFFMVKTGQWASQATL